MEFGARLTRRVARETGLEFQGQQLLVDAPPAKREGRFQVMVRSTDGQQALEEVSPVVAMFASEAFDDYVKRVRVFAPEHCVGRLRQSKDDLARWVVEEAGAE